MIVKIRYHDKGIGHTLPKLIDLTKFSEEAIRERMVEYGHDYYSTLIIVRIDDWDVDINLSLTEAYNLLKLVNSVYDGDEFLVSYLLKRRVAFSEILSSRFIFLSKDEEEAMVKVSAYYDSDTLVQIFFKTKSWGNFMCAFINNGSLLNTPKGFYWKMS
ncbi:hypothetical protein J5583_00435 [Streptococcus suis]|uniref:hypothetical protein n=1 Tax=Streptococcus suis TaxID=1307 RepID=UPI001ABDBCEC|nr:hypothetical protein [Streptococcus suis]MBO4108658.1 hypothetical protein [Streptococcus suis]HEM3629030.1 hypothetical protein [Streptococcus suis]